jgi:hypothetical protein
MAVFAVVSRSKIPMIRTRLVSLKKAMNVFTSGGITWRIACGKTIRRFFFQYERPSASAASCCPLGTACKPPGAVATAAPNAADYVVLPQTISKEPLGPFTRNGDEVWTDIIAWLHYGLIEAEELGVTAGNAEEMAKSSNVPAIQRLLGSSENWDRAWVSTINGWCRSSKRAVTTPRSSNATLARRAR